MLNAMLTSVLIYQCLFFASETHLRVLFTHCAILGRLYFSHTVSYLANYKVVVKPCLHKVIVYQNFYLQIKNVQNKKVYLQIKFFNLVEFINCECTVIDTPNYHRVRLSKSFAKFNVYSQPSLVTCLTLKSMSVNPVVVKLTNF